MKLRYSTQLSLIILIVFAGISCKKIDLEKVPFVTINEVKDIQSNSATVVCNLVDPGKGVVELRIDYATNPDFQSMQSIIINDVFTPKEFSQIISNLQTLTHYYVRAYVRDVKGSLYKSNELIEFTTLPAGGGAQYLYYDNGVNNDGIGIDGGGNFDVAIRFYNADLPQGTLEVTKMRLYFRGDASTEYYMTLSTIENGTVYLKKEEYIANPMNDVYAEYSLASSYQIPTSGIDGMYFGYYVEDPNGTYPAGVDDGPNDVSGDMILLEGGTQWMHLTDYGLTGNWNLQVYVENLKGEEFMLSRKNGKTVVVQTEKSGKTANKALKEVSLSSKAQSN